MASLPAVVEVQVLAAVEAAQAFGLVVHTVRMDYIHYHGYAGRMRVVHQALEILRGAETRAQGVEIGNLVAEGTVVRMFLEGHYLYGVIAQVDDFRQYVQAEFLKGPDLLLFACHSYVAFVDERMFALPRPAVFPPVRLGRVPDLGAEDLGHRILHRPCNIGGKPFPASSRPFDVKLVEHAVGKEKRREGDLPVAVPDRMQGIGFAAFPVVELPCQPDSGGIGRPLAENPVALTVPVQPVEKVVVEAGRERTSDSNAVTEFLYRLVTPVNHFLPGFQPFIPVVNHFCHISPNLGLLKNSYLIPSIPSLAVRR